MYADKDSVAERDKIRQFRAWLDGVNFKIYQVSQESGVKLRQFELKDDGYFAEPFSWTIPEVEMPGEVLDKAFFTYEMALSHGYKDRITSAVREMYAALECRGKVLDECQLAYQQTFGDDPRVEVKFGIYSAVIVVAIETLAQYHILFDGGGFIQPYRLEYDKGQGMVYLRFKWAELSMREYEQKLYYLNWKIRHSESEEKERYQSFRRYCNSLSSWECKFFPQLIEAPF